MSFKKEKIEKIYDKIYQKIKKNKYMKGRILMRFSRNNMINKEYNKYLDDTGFIPRRELSIDEIISKIPKTIKEYINYSIEDLKNKKKLKNYTCNVIGELIYADNEICYYECHDGNFLYVDTLKAMNFENDNCLLLNGKTLLINNLSTNNIFIDDNKYMLNSIKKKYNTYNCIKENCYINDDFRNKIEELDNYEFNDLKILSECTDFKILKEFFSEEVLQDMEKLLEDYIFYQNTYYDEEFNLIDEYIEKYGNRDLISWYEGMISTKHFVDEYINVLIECI